MPKKILLADDSLTIQKVVELTFSDSEYELVCVGNGHAGPREGPRGPPRPDPRRRRDAREERLRGLRGDQGRPADVADSGDPADRHLRAIRPRSAPSGSVRMRSSRSRSTRSSSSGRSRRSCRTRRWSRPRFPGRRRWRSGSPRRSRSEGRPLLRAAAKRPSPSTPDSRRTISRASIRIPTGDPFEEEFDRADADSAAAAFEKFDSRRGTAPAPNVPAAPASPFEVEEEIGGPSWLSDEPERSAAPERPHWMSPSIPPPPPLFDRAAGEARADDGPTAEIRPGDFDLRPKDTGTRRTPGTRRTRRRLSRRSTPTPPRRSSTFPRRCVRPSPPRSPRRPPPLPSRRPRRRFPHPHEPHELEALAQTSSIPELAQMLSSVSRSGRPFGRGYRSPRDAHRREALRPRRSGRSPGKSSRTWRRSSSSSGSRSSKPGSSDDAAPGGPAARCDK